MQFPSTVLFCFSQILGENTRAGDHSFTAIAQAHVHTSAKCGHASKVKQLIDVEDRLGHEVWALSRGI